ncbi:MAG TPA: hypothetical protein VK747_06915 [Blastocatellia bacterium]|nr:hypothetical protein [Blastocatellia bacterium]
MPTPSAKPILKMEERRAKREARRAKQREENVGRAAKMHVGRLAWEPDASQKASTPAGLRGSLMPAKNQARQPRHPHR